MVVPVLRSHQRRNEQTRQSGDGGDYGQCFRVLGERRCPGIERGHRKTDPDAERVERTCIGIVPLTHLVRRLIEIDHDRDPRHEKQQEHKPAPPAIPVELEDQTEQTQQQRQEEVVVLAFVVLQPIRGLILVSQPEPIQGFNPAFPIAGEKIRGRRGDVILPTDEIPHEIPPVHPAHLEVKKEVEILGKRRFLMGRPRHRDPLSVHVALVELDMSRISAPHPGEEHLPGRLVFHVDRRIRPLVFLPQGRPVGVLLKIVRGVKILSVQKRSRSVLLSRQVADQREGIIRLVFVRRGLGI